MAYDEEEKKDIPKVIELNPNPVIKNLEKLLEMAKKGELDSFILAGFTPENCIVTSKAGLDIVSQQQLISFMQTQVMIITMADGMFIQVGDEDDFSRFDDDDDE